MSPLFPSFPPFSHVLTCSHAFLCSPLFNYLPILPRLICFLYTFLLSRLPPALSQFYTIPIVPRVLFAIPSFPDVILVLHYSHCFPCSVCYPVFPRRYPSFTLFPLFPVFCSPMFSPVLPMLLHVLLCYSIMFSHGEHFSPLFSTALPCSLHLHIISFLLS